MKICFECSEYPPGPHGGIGSLVQIQARALANAGHQVRVVGIYPGDYPAPDIEEDQGVRVWRLRLPPYRTGWLTARWRLFRLVKRWCEARDTELIEVPDYGAPAAGWPGLPVPVVVRLSGSASFFRNEMGGKPRRSAFLLERASLRRGDYICSESRYLAKRTRELFAREAGPDTVIYNPVEVPELLPDARRVPQYVMFAGTLTRKKGIISLVRSWPRVKEESPAAELHIWGKDGQTDEGGSMEEFLRSIIPDDMAESVRFHGHVPLGELLEGFRTAGMAVLPSYAEGFALTPLHAMAAGCPTIYTTRGSGPELIEHGRTGLLVDPDRPDQIAGSILSLLHDAPLARRLGAEGRSHVERNFSREVILAQNEEFYRRCVGDFRKRGHHD